VAADEADAVAGFDALEPAAAVVPDELQAATPDSRVTAAAAASNLLLVGISIENLPLGSHLSTNYSSS
jgi:hypothetical protein